MGEKVTTEENAEAVTTPASPRVESRKLTASASTTAMMTSTAVGKRKLFDLEEATGTRYTKETKSQGFGRLSNGLSRDDLAFIALDCEFTGFGRHSDYMNPDLQVRYARLREMIVQRAVVSVGITLFHFSEEPETRSVERRQHAYTSEIFEFLFLCADDFVISPDSGTFLSSHDFDFNVMFTRGIPYTRAATDTQYLESWKKEYQLLESTAIAWENNFMNSSTKGYKVDRRKAKKRRKKQKKAVSSMRWDPLPRGLLRRFGQTGAPVVLHNGLLDLMFLFSAFEGPLPATLQEFIHAVLHVTPRLYDTKHLAESQFQEPVTFLGYLFEKCTRENLVSVEEKCESPRGKVDREIAHSTRSDVDANEPLCERYASRGYCPGGKLCPFSHDLKRILDRDEIKPLQSLSDSDVAHRRKVEQDQRGVPFRRHASPVSIAQSSPHSAGADSFQTGFIFATLTARTNNVDSHADPKLQHLERDHGSEDKPMCDVEDEDPFKVLSSSENRISSFGKGPALLFERSRFRSDQMAVSAESEEGHAS